jgi:hypothetical protein
MEPAPIPRLGTVPLDTETLTNQAPWVRAQLLDRLEGMYQGLCRDIETAELTSERGVDPRLREIQLRVIREMARLCNLDRPPAPTPEPEPDPGVVVADARGLVLEELGRVAGCLEPGA